MSDAQTESQSKVSQAKANPTHSTLDALDHERDLEQERQNRKDSAIPVFNPANYARKAGTDNGNKEAQSVEDEYPLKEDCP